MKLTGKPNVGNPHVGFDEAGTGNGLSGTAPVLDPTWRGLRLRNRPGLLYEFKLYVKTDS